MIQPKQTNETLQADIHNTVLSHGEIAVWWLGQSGYAFKTAHATWFVDLYLSDHLTQKYAYTPQPHIRMTQAPLQSSHLCEGATLLFATHKHSDHLDPVSIPHILHANPNSRLVLPQACLAYATDSLGLPREQLIPTRGDESLTLQGMTVHVIPSAHPHLSYSEADGYPCVGYVFEIDGITLYHSGDTVLYEGLANRLRPYAVDLAFLPINGTTPHLQALNVPPNMNMSEAIQLAIQMNTACLIPCHYDMFTFNTVPIEDFMVLVEQTSQNYRVLQCGERIVFRGKS
ncbi:MAG: MBL fold metallo-hydrolase [Phototrophicaceae bacterium]